MRVQFVHDFDLFGNRLNELLGFLGASTDDDDDDDAKKALR